METFKSFIYGFVAFVAMMFIQAVVSVAMLVIVGRDNSYFDSITMFTYSLAVILLFGLYYIKKTDKRGLNIPKHSAITCTLLVILGIFLQIFLAGVLNVILSYIPNEIGKYNELIDNLVSNNVFLILYVCVFGPVAEELVFREIIMTGADRVSGFIFANIFQALLFALYHGNAVQGVYAFIMGFFLGCVRKYGKSMLCNVLLHMSINITGEIVELAGLEERLLPRKSATIAATIITVSFVISMIIIRKLYIMHSDC